MTPAAASSSKHAFELVPPCYIRPCGKTLKTGRERALLQAALGKQEPAVADKAEIIPIKVVQRGREGVNIHRGVVRKNGENCAVVVWTVVHKKRSGASSLSVDVDPRLFALVVASPPLPPVEFVETADAGSPGSHQIMRRVWPSLAVDEQTKSRLPCATLA